VPSTFPTIIVVHACIFTRTDLHSEIWPLYLQEILTKNVSRAPLGRHSLIPINRYEYFAATVEEAVFWDLGGTCSCGEAIMGEDEIHR